MLFGEDQAVYVVVSSKDATTLIEKLNGHGVVGEQIGVTGGDALTIGDYGSRATIPLTDLRAAHEGFFPKLMGADAALA
jgi:phosphoribosylformylglycinamidine synthase